MKTQFDPESNILLMEVGVGVIAYAKEKNGIIVHMTSANVPVIIEILDASSFLTKLSKVTDRAKAIKPAPSPS